VLFTSSGAVDEKSADLSWLDIMSTPKITPKQALWTMFLLQIVFCLGLFSIAAYTHSREIQLLAEQPAMQASDERARTHIQTERDIEQLRAAAIHIQNESNLTWNSLIKVTKWMDLALWGFFLSSVALAVMGACTVYSFRVRKTQVSASLELMAK
jgi:hypothetical protein